VGTIEVGLVKVVASNQLGEKTQTQRLTHFVYVEQHVNALLLKLCFLNYLKHCSMALLSFRFL
jgi:hypothetical protein